MLSILAVVAAAVAQAGAPLAPLATLYPQWSVALETPAAAPAAYDMQTAYVPLRGGVLVAIDLDRGAVRWNRERAVGIAPATGDGLVFVAVEGNIEALTADHGETRWRAAIPGRVTSLAWDTGWLICGTDEGEVAALRAVDGNLVWRASLGSPMVVPPAAALDRLYLGLEGGRVVALRDVAREQALLRGSLCGRGDEVRHDQTRRKIEAVPLVAHPAPEQRRIHRDDQGFVARRFGAVDEALGEAAVLVHVELEPLRRARGLGDLLERGRREGRGGSPARAPGPRSPGARRTLRPGARMRGCLPPSARARRCRGSPRR